MKLLRYGPAGQERPGLLDKEGRIRDLSGVVADITPQVVTPEGLARLRSVDPSTLPLAQGRPRHGVPISGVGKFIAIGLNYADHAAEAGLPVPTEPIFFTKAISCLSGPDDPVMKPLEATKLDWEVELGSSSARPAVMSSATGPLTMSPASSLSMTSPSAPSRRSAAASGTRARAATPSARSAPGSSPPTRWAIARPWTCSSTSMASACRRAIRAP